MRFKSKLLLVYLVLVVMLVVVFGAVLYANSAGALEKTPIPTSTCLRTR